MSDEDIAKYAALYKAALEEDLQYRTAPHGSVAYIVARAKLREALARINAP